MKRIFLSTLICMCVANAAFAQTPYETLVTYRAQYPTPMSGLQAAALLNRVAWDFRDQGMKLLGKSGGENCPMPNGILISCDFLVHAPTLTGHDVMSGAQGGAGTVTPFVWGPGPEPLADAIASGARTLVDPVQPSSGPTPGPAPSPTPAPVGDHAVVIDIQRLANEIYKIQVEHEAAEAVERAKAEEFREAVKTKWESIGKPLLSFIGKYVAPAITTWLVASKVAK